jgi:hypothetical protein
MKCPKDCNVCKKDSSWYENIDWQEIIFICFAVFVSYLAGWWGILLFPALMTFDGFWRE